jgi:hypothetical protein
MLEPFEGSGRVSQVEETDERRVVESFAVVRNVDVLRNER